MKTIINYVKIITLALALFAGISYVAADWQGPPGNPPGCPDGTVGCNPPINVSNFTQHKLGKLKVGVVTNTPTESLNVLGASWFDGPGIFNGEVRLGEYGHLYASPPVGDLDLQVLSTTAGGEHGGRIGARQYCNETGTVCTLATALGGGGDGGGGGSWTVVDNQYGGNQYSNVGGNVGIGTSAPGVKLDVSATSNDSAVLRVKNWGTGSNAYAAHITTGGTLGSAVALYVDANGPAGGKAIVVPDGGGPIVVGNGGITLGGVTRTTWPAGGSGSGGVSEIRAGTNITIDPAGGTGVVTINANVPAGSGDNLGNHRATQNIFLGADRYISWDTGNHGLAFFASTIGDPHMEMKSTADFNIVGTGLGQGDLFVEEDADIGRTLTAQSVVESSSRRWKSNVQPIDDALSKVLNLQGVSFVWDKDHGSKPDIGLIAEEVGGVIPEVVTWEENGKDASGVNYGHLVGLLVEAIKDQQQQIENLKAAVSELKNN